MWGLNYSKWVILESTSIIHLFQHPLQGLFRNYGDTFLLLFKPHIARLSHDAQESSQRCMMEIIGGLIRGSKHWSFQQVCNSSSKGSILHSDVMLTWWMELMKKFVCGSVVWFRISWLYLMKLSSSFNEYTVQICMPEEPCITPPFIYPIT